MALMEEEEENAIPENDVEKAIEEINTEIEEETGETGEKSAAVEAD